MRLFLCTIIIFLVLTSSNKLIAQGTVDESLSNFKERYENYLSVLDQGVVASQSTLRRFGVEFQSNEALNNLYPKSTYRKCLKIGTGYVIINYVLYIHKNVIQSVKINEFLLYDTGFSTIFQHYEGNTEINLYDLSIDISKIESNILNGLIRKDHQFKYSDEFLESGIWIQLIYHNTLAN